MATTPPTPPKTPSRRRPPPTPPPSPPYSPPPTLLYALLSHPTILSLLTSHLPKSTLCALRLASTATCNLLTRPLFLRLTLTFTPTSFTRPSRLAALSRIGHHIEHLTFHLPHTPSTFLPPLLHPTTGRELGPFLYTPHTSPTDPRPQYASPELGEILTAQYPPLFHAACNVPSFLAALSHLTRLRHLTVKTPGQPAAERYRRSAVDYALVSLRIAVERCASMGGLRKLSLSGVHPGAFQYLRHGPGAMGAGPGAGRRWRQIEALRVVVEGCEVGGDQLKMMDDFLRGVAGGLEKFEWEWRGGGGRGPCPLVVFAGGEGTGAGRKLFNEVTGPMSPLPEVPGGRGMVVMPRCRFMAVRNCTMRSAAELRAVICAHRGTVREFEFENVALLERGRKGWEEALGELTEATGAKGEDRWGRYSLGSVGSSRPGTARSGSSSGVTSSVGDELTGESAAAAAASRELFEVDMEGMVFGGVNDVDAALDAGVEEWARGVTADGPGSVATIPEEDEDRGLTSEVEAAKEASLGFSTKLKKRRMRKKSKSSQDGSVVDDRSERKSHDRKSERSESSKHPSRSHSGSRHKHSRSDDTSDRHPSRERSQRHRRPRSEDMPAVPSMPEVIGTDDEEFYRPPTPPKTPPRAARKMSITAPILNADPFPVLLQPTVYDPSSKTAPFVSVCEVRFQEDDGLSSAQRLLEADMLAEARDAAARTSALRRAKETVLMKLSREFCKRSKAAPHSKDSAAVTAGLSALNLGGMVQPRGSGCAPSSMGMGMRIREGLFGRSLANVAIVPDHRGLESQSALVPLMFSRG